MKTTILLFIICVLESPLILAQDIIYFRSGEELSAKIKVVNEETVEYVKFNNQEGPKYVKSISTIFKIKYANGEQEVFKEPAKTSQPSNQNNNYHLENSGTGNKNSNKVKTNDNDVTIDVGKVLETLSNPKSKDTTGGASTEISNRSPNSTTTNISTVECIKNKTGDVLFTNNTSNPLDVFVGRRGGDYFQTLSIPIKDSKMIYSLEENIFIYQFKPSNSGQIDPTTKRLIPYFEEYGEFKIVKCVATKVILKR